MRNRFRYLCALAAGMVLSAAFSVAQTPHFEYGVDFDFRFDNREYDVSSYSRSMTVLGARVVPTVGIGIGSRNGRSSHVLMAGADVMKDFGASPIYAEMVLYYNWTQRFRKTEMSMTAGIFPRKKMNGEYSTAFFSDSLKFYDSNLDGLMANWRGRHGYVELAFDWNGKIGAGQREKFMIFSAGQLQYGAFYGGYNANMYHFACSFEENGVVDNILIYPFAGADFRTFLPAFSALYVQVGWLQSFQRDRLYVDRFVKPGGMQIELGVERWGFGIYNTLYLGAGLMPYYDSVVEGQPAYGAELYPGDPFYRTTKNIYNRLEVYWRHRFPSGVMFKVASVQHYDGTGWGWQQQIELEVPLSDKMFRKHPGPKAEEAGQPASDGRGESPRSRKAK